MVRPFRVMLAASLVLVACSSQVVGVGPKNTLSSAQIHGPLVDRDGDGQVDSSFLREASGDGKVRVTLITFEGSRMWSLDLINQSTGKPGEDPLTAPAAAGDFTGDSVDDYVFAMRGRLEPESKCGPYLETWSQLLFVDGSTGTTSSPLPPIPNKCWDFPSAGITYPTDRWSGFVQIGELSTSYRGQEVIAVANYPPDDRGWVLNFQHGGAWQKITGRDGSDSLIFPSHPDFPTHYNAANPLAPCQTTLGYPTCRVPDSHVPTGLSVGSGTTRGALMLTTGRALVYRPDLTPTSDTTWTSGTTPNGGRNYGHAVSFSQGANQYAVLIGGCSVKAAREAMRTGELPGGRQDTALGGVDAHCGIHHHYESFLLRSGRIDRHFNQYFSYSVEDGFFHGRPEFPGTPVGPLGGVGTMWTAYNLFDAPRGSQGAGQWQIQLRADPANPAVVIRKAGWFIWDVLDINGDGTAEVLATRANPDSATPYILPWEVDVLAWNGSDLESVHHRNGVAPSLFIYPNRATRHFSGSGIYGTLSAVVDQDGIKGVMVEDRHGRRSILRVPAAALKR